MKVVFLFMSSSSATPGSTINDSWKKQKCGPEYNRHNDESYFKLLGELVNNGTISDLKVFFESGVNPGRANFVPGSECYVVPEIKLIAPYIDRDTIIFVRGGFKHWHDFLLQYKATNWLMIYAANTGRDAWKWWDVVLDDLQMQNKVDSYDRYQFPFIKPVNEDIFFPQDIPQDFDICIGASYIHDKKGQWRGIELVELFKELYDWCPRMVMPGSLRRSLKTTQMLASPIYANECESPGFLSKPELAQIFNRSKIFLHLGPGGQNDRSIAEAWACGCTIIYANPPRFSPLYQSGEIGAIHFDDKEPMSHWAYRLNAILSHYTDTGDKGGLVTKIANNSALIECMGFRERIIPSFVELFKFMENHPPTIENKRSLPGLLHKYKNPLLGE